MKQSFWRVSLVLAALLPGSVQALGGTAPVTGVTSSAAQTAPLFERLSPAERQLLLSVAGVSSGDQFQPGRLLPGLPFPAPALPGARLRPRR